MLMLPTTRAVGSVILKSGFGEKIYKEHGEEMIKLNTQRAELSTQVFPKLWLVNFFPWCKCPIPPYRSENEG
jgi:hypothetical protein